MRRRSPRSLQVGLKNAFKLLRYLEEHRFGTTLKDLMEYMGMKRRPLYRLMGAMKAAGIPLASTGHCLPPARYRLEKSPLYGQMRNG